VSFPSVISNCSDVYVSAASTTGFGPLSFNWILPLNYSAAMFSLFQSLNSSVNSFVIPASVITATPSSPGMFFELQVFDYLGNSSTADIPFAISNNIYDPFVTLTVPPMGNQPFINNPFSLSSSVVQCSSIAATTITQTWSISPSVAITSQGSTVNIASLTLTAATYNLILQTTVESSGVEVGNATNIFTIFPRKAPLVAILNGPPIISVLTSGTLSLDGSSSYDPDTATGINPSAKYSWSCCTFDSTTGLCSTPTCLSNFTNLASTTSATFSQSSSLVAGQYVFTLTYSTTTARSATASTTVIVINPSLGDYILLESAQDGIFVFNSNVANAVWNATIIDGGQFNFNAYASDPLSDLYIVQVFQSSITVGGALQITAGTAVFNLPIQMDVLPYGGSLVALNAVGSSVTSLNANQTCIFLASGWKGVGTLLYEFSSAYGGQNASLSNTFTFLAPPLANTSTVTVTVTIYATSPTFGDLIQTSYSTSITINQFTLPSGQTYEGIAQQQLGYVSNVISTGTPSQALNALLNGLQYLNLLTTPSNATATIKGAYLNTLAEITFKGTVSPAVATTLINVLSIVASDPNQISAGDATILVNTLITVSTALLPTSVVQQAVLVLANTLTAAFLGAVTFSSSQMTPLVSPRNFDPTAISATSSTQGITYSQISTIINNFAHGMSLSITNFKDPVQIQTQGILMHVQNFAFTLPTSPVIMFSDSSVIMTASGGVNTNGQSPVVASLYGVKYTQNFFTFATLPNQENMTTPVIGLKVWNMLDNVEVPVSQSPPISIQIDASTVQTPGVCNYLDVASSSWNTTGMNVSSITVGQNIVCTTTHFTNFAGFVGPSTVTSGPAPQNNNLLLLLLLLLIIPIFAAALGIVVIVAIVIMKRRKGTGGEVRRKDYYQTQLEQIGI